MFSKPLFKQSCKANAGIWSFVTAITCFMLAIIILVLGNLNVSEIRSSLADMFITDAIEAQVEEQSMTYFHLADGALGNYQENFSDLKTLLTETMSDEQKSTIITNYNALISAGKTDEEARTALTDGQNEDSQKAINTLLDYYLAEREESDGSYTISYEDEKISSYVLNIIADNIYSQVASSQGEETANNAKAFIQGAISSFIESGESDATAYAGSYIPSLLKDIFYEQSFDYDGETIYISTYLTKDRIEEVSSDAIVTYNAKMDKKESELRADDTLTEEQISSELETYSSTIIASLSETLVESLPEKVSSSLTELGNMDVYGLVLGSIFFRIAGLLLPMIFVIMASNNLISGQVDSGSMAYVLSTPTKRRTVALTQLMYLVSSLLIMFALTTLTSVVCLAIVSSPEITISYSEIILLNIGAFITMLAVSGICFLASCLFNRSKLSLSVGGGLTMFFLVATILGLFGSSVIPSAIRIDAMHAFNYVSLISLFDATSILAGTTAFIWKWVILIGVGIICFTIGVFKFNKKDLPL